VIEQYARVVEADQHSVRVVTERQPSCQACDVKGGCGTSLIGKLFPQRPQQRLDLSTENFPSRLRPGDRVLIGLDEQHLHRASLLLYVTPLAGLVGGAVAGAGLGGLWGQNTQEPMSIIAGLLGLSLGLLYVRKQSAVRYRDLGQAVRLLRVEPAVYEVGVPVVREHLDSPVE